MAPEANVFLRILGNTISSGKKNKQEQAKTKKPQELV